MKLIKSLGVIVLISIVIEVSAKPKTFSLNDELLVTFEEKPFIKSDWKITYCDNGWSVCQINGKYPFGAAARIPATYLAKLTASIKGQEYSLNSSNMFNAWGDRSVKLESGTQYFSGVCNHEKWCTFRGLFSDAAGAFVAEWQIRDGVPERTIITYSDDVISLFIGNLTPPVYD